jgi:ABC-type tungstate transport system substrate-binding protein
MFLPALKIAVAACVISFASWLSNKKPELAGFIIALPLGTMLALLFSYTEFRDAAASIRFAKSILVAVPISLLFFVPFALADKLPFGFWGLYASGTGLIALGYFAHGFILKML